MNKILLRVFLASTLLISFPMLALQAQEEEDQDMLMEHMPMKGQGMHGSGSEENKNGMMDKGMMGQGMMGQGMMEECLMMGGPMGMGMMGHGKDRNTKALTEARLAFMKADLDITESQKTLWEDYANAVRARSTTFHEMRSKLKQGVQSGTALERIDARIKFMETRLEALKAVKAPLGALYATLSDTQKKKADHQLGKGPCLM